MTKPSTNGKPSTKGKVRAPTQAAAKSEPAGDRRLVELDKMPQAVKQDADRMLRDPSLIDRIPEDLRTIGIIGETTLALTLYLVGVSAQLPKPLSAIVRGQTSSGKSFVVDRVADLFPPEVVLRATSITTNTLYYFAPGTLRHRWVVAGERSRKEDDDRAEVTRALREMLESGALSKAVSVKEEGSGRRNFSCRRADCLHGNDFAGSSIRGRRQPLPAAPHGRKPGADAPGSSGHRGGRGAP
jgi:hypothetical protein